MSQDLSLTFSSLLRKRFSSVPSNRKILLFNKLQHSIIRCFEISQNINSVNVVYSMRSTFSLQINPRMHISLIKATNVAHNENLNSFCVIRFQLNENGKNASDRMQNEFSCGNNTIISSTISNS